MNLHTLLTDENHTTQHVSLLNWLSETESFISTIIMIHSFRFPDIASFLSSELFLISAFHFIFSCTGFYPFFFFFSFQFLFINECSVSEAVHDFPQQQLSLRMACSFHQCFLSAYHVQTQQSYPITVHGPHVLDYPRCFMSDAHCQFHGQHWGDVWLLVFGLSLTVCSSLFVPPKLQGLCFTSGRLYTQIHSQVRSYNFWMFK